MFVVLLKTTRPRNENWAQNRLLYFTETDTKNKLKNLRTQYTREKLKASRKLSETGTNEPTSIRWTHFDKLKFLDEFVSSKSLGAKVRNNNSN